MYHKRQPPPPPSTGVDAFEKLRALIQRGPSAWESVCQLFEDWPYDPDGYTIAMDYAQELLGLWKDSEREAPERWAKIFVDTASRTSVGHLPTAWLLVRSARLGLSHARWPWNSTKARWLFDSPKLEHITILQLWGVQDRDVEALCASPRLSGLIELELSGSLTDRAANALGEASHLGALKRITVHGGNISGEARASLERSPRLRALEALLVL